jgi:predicted aspartyl protease
MKSEMNRLTRIAILVVGAVAFSTSLQANAQQSPAVGTGQNAQLAGSRGRFTSGDNALKIPLEIDNNIILMRVSVNGSRPLKFIFDTGASHSIINSQLAGELGLKTEGQARGTATGGAIQGSYIRGVSLSVQGAEAFNQLIGSMPFPKVPGFEFDGVIGYGFINQFVVEIDYLNKTMNLYNPRTYVNSGGGKVVPLLLDGRKTPFVNTTITLEGRAPLEAKLMVDTGADGTFVMNSPFAKKQRLLADIPNLTQDKGRGAGGESERLLGRVKAVQMDQFVFDNPPVRLSLDTEGSGASEDRDGIVGGEIFRRFKVIIDYSRRQMILEPNKSFNDRYNIETGGTTFGNAEDDRKRSSIGCSLFPRMVVRRDANEISAWID